MKKILTYLGVLVAAAACAPALEIEFDHEQQAFETQGGRILIEAILPQATAQTDAVYIIGEFNGGDAAIGNDTYKLTRSETITAKWGVYLDPNAFQGGKTLADGFTFYNDPQGYERSSKNEPVTHTLSIGAGEWANVYADKWEAYFQSAPGDEGFTLPEHDGVRVYIIDQTGWDAIALYQWGDVNNFGGDWPGAQVAGSITVDGQEYKYFEYGDDIFGLSQNLIFNNNGNGTQLADYNVTFAEGVADYFFLITSDGVSSIDAPTGGGIKIPEHSGVRVWVDDQTGWDAIALYQWGDVNNFGGDWPGSQVAGSEKLGDVTYKYFEYGDDVIGLSQNLIFNNNGNGTQLADYNLTFEEGVADYFFLVTADGATLLDGPGSTPGGSGGGEEPETPAVVAKDPVTVYVQDLSGWENLYLYMWGEVNDLGGGWPGAAPAADKVKIGTVQYTAFTVEDALGRAENIILNNNDGTQTESFAVTLTEEVFLRLDAEGAITALDPRNADIRIYINNKTDWDQIALYAWGDAEAFGGWPGATPINTEVVGDTEYLVFGLDADMAGKSLNLIFNNNGGGKQLDGLAVTVPADELFLTVNASYSLGTVDGNPRGGDKKRVAVFVDDQTGWDGIALYMWGDVNNLGGDWPGAAVSGTAEVNGTAVKTFVIDGAVGKTENLIFNNNGDGIQLADYNLKFERNAYYLTVKSSGVSVF